MPVLRSGRAGEKSCQPSGNPCQLFRKSCQPFRGFCQPSRERGRRTAHAGRPGRLPVNGMEKPPPGVDRGHGGWWRRGLRPLFRSIRLRGGCILSLDCLRAYEVAETEGLPRSGLMPVRASELLAGRSLCRFEAVLQALSAPVCAHFLPENRACRHKSPHILCVTRKKRYLCPTSLIISKSNLWIGFKLYSSIQAPWPISC